VNNSRFIVRFRDCFRVYKRMNGAKGCMKDEFFVNSSKYGYYVSVFS
jgi:hypothetical protein